MSSTKISSTVRTAIAATLFAATAGIAMGHEKDVHHWFDHQRALGDGIPAGLIASPSSPAASSNGDNGGGGMPKSLKRLTAPATNCVVAQLQITDGSVAPGGCPDGAHGDGRWIVDEDKEDRRHADKARAR